MKDSKPDNNIPNQTDKNSQEPQRFEHFFNSFNDTTETDEVLKQLANFNFSDFEANKSNNKSSILEYDEDNIFNNNEENTEKMISNSNNGNNSNIDNNNISEFLLKQKINRICITMQGFNFKEKDFIGLIDFIPNLSDINPKNYNSLDKLLNVFINLLQRIKEDSLFKEKLIQQLNQNSLNTENYEKKYIQLQMALKEKEKQINVLTNKLNIEKEKIKDSNKSSQFEINSLKKENQELNNMIIEYKNQLRKLEADYKVLKEKNINEKSNNSIDLKINNANNNEYDFDNSSKIIENPKTKDKYFTVKKLNMSFTYLLKEINKMLCKYDSSLNIINKIKNDKIIDLNCNIETNLLIDEANMKIFRKNFLYNMDKILKKIEKIQTGNKDKRELKNCEKNEIKEIKEIKGEWRNRNNDYSNIMEKIGLKSKDRNNKEDDNKEESHFSNNISEDWINKIDSNKQVGYVFDKDKVISCKDEDNGAKK